VLQVNVVCFDLEGPLSPQDNAYELMGCFDNGYRVFEAISRYDDILTLERRRNYEPGDTLSLIIPFLVYHGITEEDIEAVSRKAKIVDGVKELLARVKKSWHAYMISTSYQQHAFNIAKQIGIPRNRVNATKLPLKEFYSKIDRKDLQLVASIEEKILKNLGTAPSAELKRVLDEFYRKANKTTLSILNSVRVVGGMRKMHAVKRILAGECKKPSEVVVVGDSITDFRMLEGVARNGGIAVVFNGNKYALRYGNIGLACSSMLPLSIILDAFAAGGANRALDVAGVWQKSRDAFLSNPAQIPEVYIPDDVKNLLVEHQEDEAFLKPYFSRLDCIGEREEIELLEVHAKARLLVRGRAGILG
jgi:energy-converting hydrogenase A subunit R